MIIKKNEEQTTIKPSCRDRIGFFMQEEVLYSALDIDLNKDFNSTNRYNFVFEGNGDATLFQHFYSLLGKKAQPFDIDSTSFYHGGKCGDIKNYFATQPIQLGSVWVFILDSDKPANSLKEFLEKKYQEFIDKYVFIFQYERDGWAEKELEFEDLLPEEILKQTILEASTAIGLEHGESLAAIVQNSVPYTEYSKKIHASIDVSDVQRFKQFSKKLLNKLIDEQVVVTKIKTKFEDTFSSYATWAEKSINNLKSSLKMQKDSETHTQTKNEKKK